jgi:quercetin dioxygenase-like cupin family protein
MVNSEMRNKPLALLALVLALASITFATDIFNNPQKTILGVTPQEVRWFTPPYYTDGRQRAQMFGDSNKEGPWIDRVKIPAGARVLAHTHPHDEIVTVIEGTWYLGEGEKFDAARLKPYPAGSFIVIPAGVPHFVTTKEGNVIVQVGGTGKFATDYLEK